MMRKFDLISPKYLETQVALHAAPRGYGGKGDKWAPGVRALADQLGATSILDYGCGAGALAAALRATPLGPIRVDEYDPAVKGKDGMPSFADLVVCTDVIEHVEPDRLPRVLAHLKLLARKAIFVVIATRPSSKTLSDGRNAHLILEDGDWWERTLRAAGFTIEPGPASPSPKPSREWVGVLIP